MQGIIDIITQQLLPSKLTSTYNQNKGWFKDFTVGLVITINPEYSLARKNEHSITFQIPKLKDLFSFSLSVVSNTMPSIRELSAVNNGFTGGLIIAGLIQGAGSSSNPQSNNNNADTTSEPQEVIEINDAASLAKIGNEYSLSGKFRQTGHINAAGVAPIGNKTHKFTGDFNGNCFPITDLQDCLFQGVGGNSTVRNLHIYGVHIVNKDREEVPDIDRADLVDKDEFGLIACSIGDKAKVLDSRLTNCDLKSHGKNKQNGLAVGPMTGESQVHRLEIRDCRIHGNGAGAKVGAVSPSLADQARVSNININSTKIAVAGEGKTEKCARAYAGAVGSLQDQTCMQKIKITDSELHGTGDCISAGYAAGKAFSSDTCQEKSPKLSQIEVTGSSVQAEGSDSYVALILGEGGCFGGLLKSAPITLDKVRVYDADVTVRGNNSLGAVGVAYAKSLKMTDMITRQTKIVATGNNARTGIASATCNPIESSVELKGIYSESTVVETHGERSLVGHAAAHASGINMPFMQGLITIDTVSAHRCLLKTFGHNSSAGMAAGLVSLEGWSLFGEAQGVSITIRDVYGLDSHVLSTGNHSNTGFIVGHVNELIFADIQGAGSYNITLSAKGLNGKAGYLSASDPKMRDFKSCDTIVNGQVVQTETCSENDIHQIKRKSLAPNSSDITVAPLPCEWVPVATFSLSPIFAALTTSLAVGYTGYTIYRGYKEGGQGS